MTEHAELQRPARGVPARRVPALLVGGYICLLAAWTLGNAPFASPDETAHYLRAVGIGNGELVATRERYARSAELTEQQLAWLNRFAGSVRVPAGLAPVVGTPCYVSDPTNSAACHPLDGAPGERTRLTYVATYQPLPYLLPAAALRAADDPATAVTLARLASALVFAALVALAVWLLWAPGAGTSLVGPVVALTPMSLFLGASLNPNALEIAAAVAYAAALIRLTRSEPASERVWAAGALAAAVLVLSRPTGALWLAAGSAAILLAFGGRGLRPRAARARTAALVAGGVVGVAVALMALWEGRIGGDASPSAANLKLKVEYGLYGVREVLREQIGVFGYRTVDMPYGAYVGWWALLAALMTLAFLVGHPREIVGLLGAAAAAVVVPVALFALVFADSGFALQGRYFLGLSVFVPMVAGEIVFRRRTRLAGTAIHALPVVVAVLAAVVHLTGWYWNARQNAIGANGPIWFAGVSQWAPVGTWWPWALLALAGATLVAASGVVARAARPSP